MLVLRAFDLLVSGSPAPASLVDELALALRRAGSAAYVETVKGSPVLVTEASDGRLIGRACGMDGRAGGAVSLSPRALPWSSGVKLDELPVLAQAGPAVYPPVILPE